MTIRLDQLANGVRIVTEDMPGFGSTAIGIWVTAGGRHEAEAQNGIAHFLEHMAFKGTTTRNAERIAEEIEDVGGFINAYTSRELTAYYARVLGEDVPRAFDVLADIVTNPVFHPDEVEIERGVILQEIGQALDTPDDVVFDWLQEAAYRGQALGRTILGSAERVSAFKDDDLRAFTKAHYGPDRLIVAAAGAVDHDALVRLAEEHLGHLRPAPAIGYEPGTFMSGEMRNDKPLEQAHLAMALSSPGIRDDAIYTAQVYSTLLGGGMSSRLFQEARERRGLCYTIYAQASALEDTGMLTIYAGTSGGKARELTELCIDEIRQSAENLKDAEVARARAQIKAGMMMGLEGPTSRVERLARMIAIWGYVPALDEIIAKIDAVDIPALQDFAFGLRAAPMAMALYGPVSGAPTVHDLRARIAA